MDREKEQTKTELLSELESIQGLLLDDIPLLNEVIDKAETGTRVQVSSATDAQPYSSESVQGSEEQNYELDLGTAPTLTPQQDSPDYGDQPATNPRPESTLDNQQPLFALAQSSVDSSREPHTASTKAMGENPFLPQHIRERLKGNRAAEFSQLSASQAMSQNALVEELIQSVMPQLEAQLRLKLSSMTEDQLQHLLQNKTD
ncbi:hypothetical protein [Gilvimarinus sp. DA14]|uniref:hypothetical protein n=1 Tax=Gilvimarinus sp. DA14 TaxID=2956798 RepID=UPI0020B83BE7|nr:hypothetical protein [Gilvimarinus sp. DA14]UTF60891.1 hypothetical protein NHM04_03565 [Gilvimarinus sp. DA14]